MKLTDFFQAVEEDDGLQGVNIVIAEKPEDDAVVVEDVSKYPNYTTQITAPLVLDLEWAKLRGIIMGEVRLDPLYHVTRIVGYFSRIENWNVSKLGELADRRAAVEHYAAFDKMGNFEKKGGIDEEKEQ